MWSLCHPLDTTCSIIFSFLQQTPASAAAITIFPYLQNTPQYPAADFFFLKKVCGMQENMVLSVTFCITQMLKAQVH